MESQNQSMVVSSVNSSGGLAFLGNIDRFSLTRNVLIGYVYITYIHLENLEFFNIKTIGILVNSYIILIPIHQISKEVMKNPTLRFRFTPFETKHKKDNIFSLDLNKIENILYGQREKSNNINLFFRYVSEESTGSDSSAQKKIYFPDSKWALIILENPIGEFLLNYNLLEVKYFKLNDTYGTSANRKMKIYYSTIIKFDGREDVETSSTAVDSKILWFDSQKFYIAFSKDLKFFNMDGIVYLRSFQIIGIYEGGKSQVYDSIQMKRIINKEVDNNNLANNYNNILKSYAGICKENELKYLEVEFLNNKDIKDLQLSLERIKKYFFSEVGTLSLELNHFSSFQEHFNCYERLLTLFVAGPIVIKRICEDLNINFKTLDRNLLVKKLINDDMNDRYNLESLEIIDYNLKDDYFQTIIESFYFSRNLLYLDLSGNLINLDKALVLSNFLYIKKNLKKLNLARTGMGLTELYIVLQGLIEGQINKGQTSSSLYSLNLSQNNFYENSKSNNYYDNLVLNEILNFDFPNDLSFLRMIFDIKSLKELFIQDLHFKNKDDIAGLFKEVTRSMLHDEADEEEDSEEETSEKDHQEKMIRLYRHNTQYGIKLLNFSNNNLKKESMSAISNYLSIAGSVEEIIFSKCAIDDNMTGILCAGLQERNKYSKGGDCLKLLDLSNNLICWKGANKLKEFLSTLKKSPDDAFNKSSSNRNEWFDLSTLSNHFSLILDNNVALSEGISKICEGISLNSPALSLSFKNVSLKNIDLEAIYNVLIFGYPIKFLSLAGNKLDDSIFEMFKLNKALASTKCLLQTLDLHSNKISMDGIYHLLSGFQGTPAYMLKKSKFYIICDPFEIKINVKKENKLGERTGRLNSISSFKFASCYFFIFCELH
jgi:hypothetical protein